MAVPPVHLLLSLPFNTCIAVTLTCSYSGYTSPRVEWKFTHGDITSLVCFNGKITGELMGPCVLLRGHKKPHVYP